MQEDVYETNDLPESDQDRTKEVNYFMLFQGILKLTVKRVKKLTNTRSRTTIYFYT